MQSPAEVYLIIIISSNQLYPGFQVFLIILQVFMYHTTNWQQTPPLVNHASILFEHGHTLLSYNH